MSLELSGRHGEPTAVYSTSPRNHGRCCARFGHTRVICAISKRYGYFPTTCHVGPHWGCMIVTYCLVFAPAAFFVIDDVLFGIKVALVVSICVTSLSFTMVACSDPGIVFQDLEVANQPLQDDIETGVICAQCEVRRPLKASHCTDCGVCVRGLDHHCPWTGKCVGERTLKWFYVFLTSISVHCMLIGAVFLSIIVF